MKLLGKILGLILLVAVLFPSAYMLFISTTTIYDELRLWWELREARRWPTVEVNVIETKTVPLPEWPLPTIPEFHCIFSYEVNGRPYTVDYSKFSGRYGMMAMNRTGLERQMHSPLLLNRPKVFAHVNPDNPAEAVPTSAIDDAALGAELAGACFVFVLGSFISLLWAIPSFAIVRSMVRSGGEDPAKQAEKARILEAHSGLKWLWFGLTMLTAPGVIPMTLFTLPYLLEGGRDQTYWWPFGIQCLLPVPFLLLWLRSVRSWKLIGQSRIELAPFPVTFTLPPKGRLILAPIAECPDTITVKYELLHRITSKNIRTVFKTDVTVQRAGISPYAPDAWYPIDHTFQGIPDYSRVSPQPTGMFWNITVFGQSNGRKFRVPFVRQIS